MDPVFFVRSVLGRLGLTELVRPVERRKLPKELERARKPIVVCSPS